MLRSRLALAVAVACLPALAACGAVTARPAAPSPTGGGGPCHYSITGAAAKPVQPPPPSPAPLTGQATVVLKMTAGDVAITLNRDTTRCTVSSFLSLERQGYFDQTSCHRLTTAGIFVLQCGDPTGSGSGGPGYAYASELTGRESYTRGVVAMANAGPDTNGSQFFLVYADSTQLDQSPNYTIFGRMTAASTRVVAKIAAGGQDGSNGDGDGKPVTKATIVSVSER